MFYILAQNSFSQNSFFIKECVFWRQKSSEIFIMALSKDGEYQARSLIGSTHFKLDFVKVGELIVDHCPLSARRAFFHVATANAGMPKEIQKQKFSFDGSVQSDEATELLVSKLQLPLLKLLECHGFPSDGFAAEGLLEYCPGGNLASFQHSSRLVSNFDRHYNLTEMIMSALTGRPYSFEFVAPPSHATVHHTHDELEPIQKLLIELLIAMYREVFAEITPEFVVEPVTEDVIGTVITFIAQKLKEKSKVIIGLQEVRDTEHIKRALRVVPNDDSCVQVVLGAPETPTHPTVAIVFQGNFNLTKIETGMDDRRVLAVHVESLNDESPDFIVVNFHGDVSNGESSINHQVASFIKSCPPLEVVYLGDYQGGKKGADCTIFPGYQTPPRGTREPQPKSYFGFNQGIKNWSKLC